MDFAQLVKNKKWREIDKILIIPWFRWHRLVCWKKMGLFILGSIVVAGFTWKIRKSHAAQANNQGVQENQESQEQNQQSQFFHGNQAQNENVQESENGQVQNLSNQEIQFQYQQQQEQEELQLQGGQTDNGSEQDKNSDKKAQNQINDDGPGLENNQFVCADALKFEEKSLGPKPRDLQENVQDLTTTTKAGGSALDKSADVNLSKEQVNSKVLLEQKYEGSGYGSAIEAPKQFEQSIVQEIQESKEDFNQKREHAPEFDHSVVQVEQPLRQDFNQSMQFEVIEQKSPQKNNDFQVEANEKMSQVAEGQVENLRELEKQDEEEEKEKGPLQLIHRLYELSCNSRQVPEEYQRFVGAESGVEALVQEYAPQNQKLANELRNCLNGFRRIRGDGNCFYTAFVSQYLQWLLSQQSEETFDQRIKELQNMKSFKICYPEKNFNIEEESQTKELARIFARRLISLRRKPGLLLSQLADTGNPLYGLSIIYLRNLVAQIIEGDEEKLMFFGLDVDGAENKLKELFEWEKECNSTEVVILALAEHLNLTVNTFHVETENSTVLRNSYNNEHQQKGQINLLFQPGHYQVGIPKVVF